MRSNGNSEANLASFCSDDWDRVGEKQEEWLLPLKEDLAAWINRTLGQSHITAENLIDVLDNGVTVCQLAKMIHQKAVTKDSQIVPPFKFKWWPNAQSFSFFARDNTANFLRWCRQFRINEAVLFESDSLVLHTQPRAVILCLLELSRVAARFGIDPPGLVKLEKEIDEKEIANSKETETQIALASSQASLRPKKKGHSSVESSSEPDAACDRPPSTSSSRSETTDTSSELHTKVLQIANAHCSRSYVRQITDGKYLIAGKIVFVRLLNDHHVMVRVGGGWDTLEHFIAHHSPGSEPPSREALLVENVDQVAGDARPRLHRQKSATPTKRRHSVGFIF